MIFSAASFLYLLPLAGLPVVFHLIFKQKRRQFVFSTLMFFHRTDPRLNSRRKIRQWLLLLARILFILLILLALSRPSLQSRSAVGGRISVVALVDNSGSMSGSAGADATKLERAVDGAERLVSSLAKGSRAAMVTLVDDPMVASYDALSGDLDSVLADLAEIRPTHATGDPENALSRALELLQASKAGGGVVHVFTDLQSVEWAPDAMQIRGAAGAVTVYLHRIETQAANRPNVAIIAVKMPQERILPQHSYTISVVLQNRSGAPADVRLNWIDDQGRQNTENVALNPSQSSAVELDTGPHEAGHHWIKTWIEGDGFSADNEAGIGISCDQTATALFAGSPGQFGVLGVALSPTSRGEHTGIVTDFCRTDELKARAAEEPPIIIVMTWEDMDLSSENSAWLQNYVETGGNLLIAPAASQSASAPQAPQWLGASLKARKAYARAESIEVLDKQAEFWARIRTAAGKLESPDASVFASFAMQLSSAYTPLLGTDFKNVILAHRQLGRGNIYVSGTAFDPRWNTLPQTPLLVVMAQRMAVAGAFANQNRTLSLVAGKRPEGIEAEGQIVEIISLAGDALEWKGLADEIPCFARAGVYLLKTPDRKLCISVRASDAEGQTRFIRDDKIAGLGAVTHKVLDYDASGDFKQYHLGQAKVVEFYLPLLLLATIVLIAEGLLANLRGAKLPTAEDVTTGRTYDDQPQEQDDRSVKEKIRSAIFSGRAV